MGRLSALVVSALASLMLSGCITTRPAGSFVAPGISPADATLLAKDAAVYLTTVLPPAKSTLVIQRPAGYGDDLVSPAFMAALRAAGYGVIEAGAESSQVVGISVRYLASPLDDGMLLRLQYGSTEAARFYPRTATGAVGIGAPFVVRESQ